MKKNICAQLNKDTYIMEDLNQELANLSPEQRQLIELMLRKSENRLPTWNRRY